MEKYRCTVTLPYHFESKTLWYVQLENPRDETDSEILSSHPSEEEARAAAMTGNAVLRAVRRLAKGE